MKNLLLSLLLCAVGFGLQAQEPAAPPYVMFENTVLKAKPGHYADFGWGLRDHHANFHAEGPHRVNVWTVVSGPRAGHMICSQGPMTLSDLDAEMDEEHGNHWRRAVLSHTASGALGSNYWVRMDELSSPADHLQSILRIRFRTVKSGQMGAATAWLEQLSAVVNSWEDKPFGFQVFRNHFAQGTTGPSFANVNSFDDWTTMDNWQGQGGSLREAFEKVHGEGSYAEWQQAGPEIFAEDYDEIWTLAPWLSSPELEAKK